MSDPAGAAELAIHVLGSGTGLPTAERDTSSLLVRCPDGWTLIDCPGALVHRLARLGVRPADVRRLLVTHNHVDHIYGFPHLVHALGIEGTVESLELHAPAQTLGTIAAMARVHSLSGGRYPALALREIELAEGFQVVESSGLRISATPTSHGRDTVALRFDAGAAAFCHSSDTRPSRSVAELARGVDLLMHDCGGPHRLRDRFSVNHSSAREAAEAATTAGVGRLVLMHLGSRSDEDLTECLAEAGALFGGPVALARDGECYVVPADDDAGSR